MALTDAETSALLPLRQLAARMEAVGTTGAEKVIACCAARVNATSDAFVLKLLGVRDVTVYDAGLADWGGAPGTPPRRRHGPGGFRTMAYDNELADRIRYALSGDAPVREVKMFGGLAFMVNDKMAATANSHGQLMVRCDPDRVEELLKRDGADWPEMRGRKMSRGWIVVDANGTESDQDFTYWIKEALTYNRKSNGSGG